MDYKDEDDMAELERKIRQTYCLIEHDVTVVWYRTAEMPEHALKVAKKELKVCSECCFLVMV